MEQIHQKRMLAEEVQQRKLPPGKQFLVPTCPIRDPEKVETCQKQEKPRQQREIIGREETRLGKTQIGGQIITVQPIGQRPKHDFFETQRPFAAVSQQKEQSETQSRAQDRGDFFQRLFQRDQQQNTAADAGEDAKENAAFGHHSTGDKRHGHSAAEDQQTPFQMIAAHSPAEAGKQNE